MWCACHTLFSQCSAEQNNKAPFAIDVSLRKDLLKVVVEQEETLKATYYPPKSKDDVYSDIVRLHNNFYKDYKVLLLLP